MGNNNIDKTLERLFEEHRVIFWYDEKEELTDQYESLELPEVEKIQVDGNEFQVKYQVTKEFPDHKFLLYSVGVKPVDEENWLLDMELAHHVFYTDQEAMFLQELELRLHLKELVGEHIEFFKAKERRSKLKELLGAGDHQRTIRKKMLAVTFNTDFVAANSMIQAHATAHIKEDDQIERDLERFGLSSYYWSWIEDQFGYSSDTPSIYEFLWEAFQANFALGDSSSLNRESRLLLLQWKDTLPHRESFGEVSAKLGKDMNIESRLHDASLDEIIDDDLFRLTDLKVIHELVRMITTGDFSVDKVLGYIKKREIKFWSDEFRFFYNSLEYGAQFIHLVNKKSTVKYSAFEEGILDYSQSLYEIDQLYRKFIFSYGRTNQNRILHDLDQKIDKVYSNKWLLRYNDNWQQVVDQLDGWPVKNHMSQRQFFLRYVKPYIDKQQRLFVIISDALRYECGEELHSLLLAENRYDSNITPAVASLPSYTQLGMASLLPHQEIAFQKGGDGILVDGMAASGVQGRSKILGENAGVRATAIQADAFMNMNTKSEGREFVKQYDLIYIYHNRIDKTGDDKMSEEKVFDAVEDELEYLMDVLKKISNMNGTNMIITADHGFIYQHHDLDESDYMKSGHSGTIWKENRRFVLGAELKSSQGMSRYNGPQLGINSEVDVLIPKSINRLRVKGAGSRFVHGGATLQEIVVPVINVSKKRQDTTSQVDIDIIKGTDRITTSILAVSFIQSEQVTETTLPRTMRAYIQAEDGVVLSDVFTYNFDIQEGSERQREVKHRFQLIGKASGKYKNQRVSLKMEEPVEGTTKWKSYKEFYYTLMISFTADFDDF